MTTPTTTLPTPVHDLCIPGGVIRPDLSGATPDVLRAVASAMDREYERRIRIDAHLVRAGRHPGGRSEAAAKEDGRLCELAEWAAMIRGWAERVER